MVPQRSQSQVREHSPVSVEWLFYSLKGRLWAETGRKEAEPGERASGRGKGRCNRQWLLAVTSWPGSLCVPVTWDLTSQCGWLSSTPGTPASWAGQPL